MNTTTIIRDNAGQTFRVTDATTYDHAWVAVPVKRTANGWADKAKATPRLVRRLFTVVVEG